MIENLTPINTRIYSIEMFDIIVKKSAYFDLYLNIEL